MDPTATPGLVVHPVRSTFLTLGQVAIGVIALAVAAALVAAPTGAARVGGIVAAIALVAAAAYVIRSLRRQAVVTDVARIGWRRGLTGRVGSWTAFVDVEGVTTAKASTSISRKRADVILWTRTGGMRGVDAILLRPQLGADARRQLQERSGSDAPLHPFLVPFTAMKTDDREAVTARLRAHGLLPE
jgi:hypothetical protein